MNARQLRRVTAAVTLAAALGAGRLASDAAASTIFQCKGADGRISMQDRPCAGGELQSEQDVQDAYRGTPTKTKRSAKAKADFQREHPCPRTGARRGRCPGHDIDHIKPLCAGGADLPANMQWLTLEQHREKTRLDLFECRSLRRGVAR